MIDLRSVRNFLGLRLIDVSAAVGVSTERISLAERGMGELHPTEQSAIEDFLRARLASVVEEAEQERSVHDFPSPIEKCPGQKR